MAIKFKACSVGGCNGNSHSSRLGAKGFCNKHYKRLLKHGDPLAGRTPEGEPMAFFLEKVVPYEGDDCLSWPYGANGLGYGRLTVNGTQAYVHRMACQSAHGDPPTSEHEAAHSCGNGHLGCVNPRHLSWKTCQENLADKVIHGTNHRGEKSGASKLTESQVLEIRSLKGHLTQAVIAGMYGIGQTTVSHIMRRDSWDWLD